MEPARPRAHTVAYIPHVPLWNERDRGSIAAVQPPGFGRRPAGAAAPHWCAAASVALFHGYVSQQARLRWTDPGPKALKRKTSVRGLDERDLSAVFQPILSLSNGTTFAHEALARCSSPDFPTPIDLFEHAAQERACGRLGRLVRNVIFENCARRPIFVNLHPQELHQRWLVQPTDPLFLHDGPIYLEITENAALRYFDVCVSVLADVCGRCNARLVVDDLGAGHADMERVLLLRPHVVKLDMSLIRDIDRDPERQKVVLSMVEHCHALGARVVAEGIQGIDELHVMRDFGVEYGQGYLLGKPQPKLADGWWPVNDAPFVTENPSAGIPDTRIPDTAISDTPISDMVALGSSDPL